NEQDIEYEKSICYNEGREEGLAEGREEGREEGRRENALSTAKNLLAKGVDAQTIAECTGLALDVVLSLDKE
ncbi:MAG: hypothetical protein ACI3Z0_10910, partial [Candidatus Cryptobacteroides sp.]